MPSSEHSRIVYQGHCQRGHVDTVYAAWDDRRAPSIPTACQFLNRDVNGAWRESYGSCGAPVTWQEFEETRPAYRSRRTTAKGARDAE